MISIKAKNGQIRKLAAVDLASGIPFSIELSEKFL